MAKRRFPKTFPINHDDYHAKHIGRLADGRQFFLTTPFVPAVGKQPGCEFVALFLFAADGTFLEAKIDKLGPRSQVDQARAQTLIQARLDEVQAAGGKFGRIKVAPFETKEHDVRFGFIPQEADDEEDEGDDVMIELQPGNYMAFGDPWDGDYDT